MAALPVLDLVLPVDHVSIARLHGEACIKCGSTVLPLMHNGYVRTRGSDDSVLSWLVVACQPCWGRPVC